MISLRCIVQSSESIHQIQITTYLITSSKMIVKLKERKSPLTGLNVGKQAQLQNQLPCLITLQIRSRTELTDQECCINTKAELQVPRRSARKSKLLGFLNSVCNVCIKLNN